MMNTILLTGLWQGAIITAFGFLITICLPQRHAATRHAVWFAALIALAIVPVVSLWQLAPSAQALPLPVAHAAQSPSIVTARAATASGAWLLALWLAGVVLGLTRLCVSHVRITRILRSAKPAPELGPAVLTSERVSIPIAAGLLAPRVIVPAYLVDAIDRSDLENIIQHERAHIRRGDICGNLVQRLIEATLFFNPWAYVIGRQLIKERESACDDWAVHSMDAPDRYAACLAQLARGAHNSHTPLLTPSAIGSKQMLIGRIARLLDGKVIQLKINYLVLGASVISFAILAVLLHTSNGPAWAASAPSTLATIHGFSPKCDRSAMPTNAAPPNIAQADMHPNVYATALVTVASDGHVADAKIVKSSGYSAIDFATVQAARASTYEPAMSNCKKVAGQYLFQVRTAAP